MSTKNELHIYRNTPDACESKVFDVSVNGEKIFTEQLFSIHFAKFACNGDVDVKISIGENIEKCVVFPDNTLKNYKINGNSVEFSVSVQPRHLYVKINDLENLILFIDKIRQDKPTLNDNNVVNIMDFVTDNTGKTDQTANIAAAIEHTASLSDKNVLFFPDGVYVSDTINVFDKENLTLYLDEGCMINCLMDTNAYMPAGIYVKNSKNIKVCGSGVYNHTGKEFFELCDYHKYADLQISPILVVDSENVVLEDFIVKNGRMWNISCHNNLDLRIENCKVLTPPESCPEWTDGINICACTNVVVEDCFVYCNDDCFASGHYFETVANKDMCNVLFKNYLGWNPRANSIRIGWDSRFNLKNYLFKDCYFIASNDQALIVHPLKENAVYDTIALDNCSFLNCENFTQLIEITGKLPELILKDVTFDKLAPSRFENVQRLVIDNVVIEGKKVTCIEDMAATVKNVGEIIIR